MNNKTILSDLKLLFKKEIEEVLLKEIIPIKEFEKILVDNFDFEELELSGEETNGWQVDFWYEFKSLTMGIYTLKGSLMYGNYKFYKNE